VSKNGQRITWDMFKAAVRAAGLRHLGRKNGHWQIVGKGGRRVHYIPSRWHGGHAYVDNFPMRVDCDLGSAIELARMAPKEIQTSSKPKKKSKKSYRDHRLHLLDKFDGQALCHWCHKVLNLRTSTIDHLIPRSRGGTDRRTNLVLACYGCNQAKRDMMPETFRSSQEHAMCTWSART
jgi:hypothetical protein